MSNKSTSHLLGRTSIGYKYQLSLIDPCNSIMLQTDLAKTNYISTGAWFIML